MRFKPVVSSIDLKDFLNITKAIYFNNPNYRATEDEIVKLLIKGPTVFHTHAKVFPFLVTKDSQTVGRFALIYDMKLPNYLQIAFFEAFHNLPHLLESILLKAKSLELPCTQFVVGLNGHLNYSAGILLDHFDEPPVFGLPYSPPYYQDYFFDLKKRTMVSYHFPNKPFFEYINRPDIDSDLAGITVRNMNKKKFKQEMGVYSYLNNACFQEHPFWADRTPAEDLELFNPFRLLMKEDYLLFAEYDGKPIGFILWYPNFNELITGHAHLGLQHVIRYLLHNPIKTFRYTQIAVLPEFRKSKATLALFVAMVQAVQRAGYEYGEAGYVFEENQKSISMSRRFLERGLGTKIEPYRRYAIYEGNL
jgi:hypothetical protein